MALEAHAMNLAPFCFCIALSCRFLNHSKTLGGARLLRANLLQPLTSLETVRMRQDAVQELISDNDLAFTLGQGLSQMPKDLDRCAAECRALCTWPSAFVSSCNAIQAKE